MKIENLKQLQETLIDAIDYSLVRSKELDEGYNSIFTANDVHESSFLLGRADLASDLYIAIFGIKEFEELLKMLYDKTKEKELENPVEYHETIYFHTCPDPLENCETCENREKCKEYHKEV